MEENTIDEIEWEAPEYDHKEKTPDFLWTIGLCAIVVCILALWFRNYLFAIFVLISGCCLILFSTRKPQIMHFAINNEGIKLGRDMHIWKNIKGFTLKNDPKAKPKLLIQTNRHFLPIYTIPLPFELVQQIRESLLKKSSLIPLEESGSMQFMEKLGF